MDNLSQYADQEDEINQLSEEIESVSKELNNKGILVNSSANLMNAANTYHEFINRTNLTGLTNGDTISICLTAFSTALDMKETVETYAMAKANSSAFLENLDILDYLATYGNRNVAQHAAKDIYDLMANGLKDYNKQLDEALSEDISDNARELAISEIVNAMPFVSKVKLAYDIMDILLGSSKAVAATDKSRFYESITTAVSELVSFSLTKTGCNYDIAGTDNGAVSRYLTNLAQLRILSEKNFVDLCESGIGVYIKSLSFSVEDDAKAYYKDTLARIKEDAVELNLSLYPFN